VAYYLTFEKQRIPSPALYAPAGASAEERFEALVGMPLDEFEPRWRKHMLQLK
jgi:hypothetical protein